MKNAPVNTSKNVGIDMIASMGIMGGNGDGILRQEAEGQKSFVGSDTLPTDISPADRAMLESLGAKFLGEVPGDSIFQYVELPSGWSKKATEHSMHSLLVDDKGRTRGGIFYKAALYDRSSHMSLNCRFSFRRDYDLSKTGVEVCNIFDGENLCHTTSPLSHSYFKDEWEASDAASEAAKAWLEKNYPGWQDAGKHWD